MKITFVAPGLGGGGGRVILEYGRGLGRRGHDVRILYRRDRTTVRNILRTLYLRARYDGRDEWFRSYPYECVAYDRLTPDLVGRNDAVIAVGADCTLAVADLPGSCGVKIHNCHGREINNREKMSESWLLKMPRIVVATYLEREMRQQGSTDEIHLVHNGVDQHAYFPSVPFERRSGIGTVYHGAPTKGPEMMLEVYQRIHQLKPEIPLMMFGSYPHPPGLPMGTRYVRLPSVPQARDIYSSAQIWLCTSRSEGFPGPVLEAMACGCPIVATDCGGTADQIEDGVNGFIVPVDDAAEMTERVMRLLNAPDLRKQFSKASEARLQQLTWPRAIESMENALEAIIANSSPS
ncbi:MAG: glycosyltransferase family 4 protein, partial [Verrucomicrobiota bacterium]